MKATARQRLFLGLILAAAAAARFHDLSADAPLDGARDLSLSTDGAWYAGRALGRARGQDEPAGGPYDRPIYTALVAAAARLLGPGIPAAALVAAVSGLAAIALTARVAERVHGPLAGILAAAILSLDYAFLVHSRASNVYMPAALVAASVLWCLAGPERPGWRRAALAWALVVLGALFLKSILLVLLPALWWALPPPAEARRVLRRVPFLVAEAALAALALAVAWRTGWLHDQAHKLREYVLQGPGAEAPGGGGFVYTLFTLELRSGLISLSPALLALAVARLFAAGPRCPAERLAAGHVFLTAALLLPLRYAPARYFLPVYPALALLASRALSDLLGRSSAWGTAAPAPSPLRAWQVGTRALLGAYLFLQGALALTGPPGSLLLSGLALVAVAAAAAAACFCRRRAACCAREGQGLRWASLAVLGAGAALGAGRGGAALAEPRHSLRNACNEIDAILPSCAYLTGPFAHALTYESGLKRKYIPRLLFGDGALARTLRREGFTHLATDLPRDPGPLLSAFASDGARLEPVWEFTVRGTRVMVFRFPWAGEVCPPGDFELGMKALFFGRRADAEEHLRRVRAEHPRSAAAAAALGATLVDQGRKGEGVALLEEALRWNPDELRAARLLLSIRLLDSDFQAARDLLLRIARADPADAEAVRLAAQLRAVP